MRRSLALAATALVIGFTPPPAIAGIADSPPPLLSGQPSQVIYSVTNVINNANLGTFFSCTNASTSTAQIGVELFGPAGGGPLNNASTTALSVGAGATVMFGTGSVFGLSPDQNLSAPVLPNGSARIVATSKSLVCNAFVGDKLSAPPASMMYLTIVAKAKQKAAN